MIHPKMQTALGFIASLMPQIDGPAYEDTLSTNADQISNQIIVDGDTSNNDMWWSCGEWSVDNPSLCRTH